jgi:hypothetical protein
VSSFFEQTYITKPATSRPGNSEIYLVGKGFKGMSSEMIEALTERGELFKTLGVNPTTLGSLVTQEVLATVDPALYKIADEFFMNIQINFINEYVNVYKQYGERMDILENSVEKLIKDTEKNWLAENGVIAIKPEESLTWYRHSGKRGMKGGDGDTDVDSDADNLNYPTSLEDNNIQPGQIHGDVAGADYTLVEKEAVLLDETNSNGASEFEGANAYAGTNVAGTNVVGTNVAGTNVVGTNAKVGGGAEAALVMTSTIQQPNNEGPNNKGPNNEGSLLEFKEDVKAETDKVEEENNSVKKLITIS